MKGEWGLRKRRGLCVNDTFRKQSRALFIGLLIFAGLLGARAVEKEHFSVLAVMAGGA